MGERHDSSSMTTFAAFFRFASENLEAFGNGWTITLHTRREGKYFRVGCIVYVLH